MPVQYASTSTAAPQNPAARTPVAAATAAAGTRGSAKVGGQPASKAAHTGPGPVQRQQPRQQQQQQQQWKPASPVEAALRIASGAEEAAGTGQSTGHTMHTGTQPDRPQDTAPVRPVLDTAAAAAPPSRQTEASPPTKATSRPGVSAVHTRDSTAASGSRSVGQRLQSPIHGTVIEEVIDDESSPARQQTARQQKQAAHDQSKADSGPMQAPKELNRAPAQATAADDTQGGSAAAATAAGSAQDTHNATNLSLASPPAPAAVPRTSTGAVGSRPSRSGESSAPATGTSTQYLGGCTTLVCNMLHRQCMHGALDTCMEDWQQQQVGDL